MEFFADVAQHVFSWLSAKPIYRFKAVSKSYYEFTSEKFFALSQSHHLQLKDESGFFIQPSFFLWRNHDELKVEYHSLPGEQYLSSGLPKKSLRFLENFGSRVLATSNGVILCENTRSIPNDDDRLFLCNPATQTWLTIPTPQGLGGVNWPKGVVFQCNINTPIAISPDDHQLDYMLLTIIQEPREWLPHYECKVYTPKEGTWSDAKKVHKFGARNLRLEMPVYHNGAIHFVSDCFPYVAKGSSSYRPYILVYHIKSGTSRMLRVPKDARRGSDDLHHQPNLGIFKWGSRGSSSESICLVRLRKSVFTTWVLRDYDSVSWVRIMKIRVRAMGLKEPDPIDILGFTIMNGKTLLFATQNKVYSYDLIDQNQQIDEVCEHQCQFGKRKVCFNSYSNTLHPLGIGATKFPEIYKAFHNW